MPDKPVRSIDPLGIIALADVLVNHGPLYCSCEGKPGPGCSCQDKPPGCSCEDKPGPGCSCQLKPVKTDILEVVSNPIFREVVAGMDIKKLKSIEDFLSVVEEIRTKMNSSKLPTRSTGKKKS